MKKMFRWLGAAFLALVLLLIPARPCSAQCTETLPEGVIAVDLDSTAGSPDGRSWECAFDDLIEALDYARNEANEVTQIWCKAGTYTLDSATDTFELVDGVWLLGGFAGTETTDRKQAKPYINETILDGDGVAYHVVTAIETEADGPIDFTRLDGFIIQNGDAASDSTHPRGGGLIMRNENEDPASSNFWLKVSRCRFRDNNSTRGGAVAVYRPLDGSASAVHHLELTNCEFTGNTATNGGAVWTFGAIIQINNSLFVGNVATNQGGAIALAQTCTNDPTNCGIRSCISLQKSDVAVNSCTLTKNQATNGAGGGEGGGIHARYMMELAVTGSIIWDNTDGSSATDTEQAQIVREFYCDVELESTATYSCIEDLDLYTDTGNIGDDEDPEFVNESQGNFRLKSISPCKDAGAFGVDFPDDVLDFNNDSQTSSQSVPDLDQLLRVRNCVVDMGCHEHECNCEADMVSSLTFQPPGDGTVNAADLSFLLGEWGTNPGSPADMVDSDTFQPPPDGVVDAADLAYLLGSWGTCPEECDCEESMMGGGGNPYEETEIGDLLDELLETEDEEEATALIEQLLELLGG